MAVRKKEFVLKTVTVLSALGRAEDTRESYALAYDGSLADLHIVHEWSSKEGIPRSMRIELGAFFSASGPEQDSLRGLMARLFVAFDA